MLVLVAISCLLIPLFSATTPAFAQQADPVGAADQAVAEAQAQVDQVAGAYFDALERTRQLESRISDLQRRIDELRQRVTDLKKITSDRAVAAYKRSGNSLGGLSLDSSTTTKPSGRYAVHRMTCRVSFGSSIGRARARQARRLASRSRTSRSTPSSSRRRTDGRSQSTSSSKRNGKQRQPRRPRPRPRRRPIRPRLQRPQPSHRHQRTPRPHRSLPITPPRAASIRTTTTRT